MSEETLEPPLPPVGDAHRSRRRTPVRAQICTPQGRSEVLAAADQAQPASADGSDYRERMRVEYRELTARAGRLRDMLQRYADGTLDFEPTCPITLLSRQLDVMDEYALILRRRAGIEHISFGEQRIDTATRDTR